MTNAVLPVPMSPLENLWVEVRSIHVAEIVFLNIEGSVLPVEIDNPLLLRGSFINGQRTQQPPTNQS